MSNLLTKISDTFNGGLNKLLIDGYIIIRDSDGHVLTDQEIMKLTRPFFKISEELIKLEELKKEFKDEILFKVI